jgi:hypothetical protein
MTLADWAALFITVGWAVTAFLMVHRITRRPSDATSDARRPPSGDGEPDPS